MPKAIVIIPTYNEIENIEDIIKAVFNLQQAFNILVVDDNSPDGTAGLVKEKQKAYPDRVFLEERTGKLG